MELPPDDECLPELVPNSDDGGECLSELLPSSDEGECRAHRQQNVAARRRAVAEVAAHLVDQVGAGNRRAESGPRWHDPMPDECCSRNCRNQLPVAMRDFAAETRQRIASMSKRDADVFILNLVTQS